MKKSELRKYSILAVGGHGIPLRAIFLSVSLHLSLVLVLLISIYLPPFNFFPFGGSDKKYKLVRAHLVEGVKGHKSLLSEAYSMKDPRGGKGLSLTFIKAPDQRGKRQFCRNHAPSYPKLARDLGIKGTVLLDVLVSPQGSPWIVEIKSSSGFEILDKAAVEAVWLWEFIPAVRDGSLIAEYTTVPIKFGL